MNRKRIAVVFGGCSSEHGVSLNSAAAVIEHMDREKFEPVPVGITREGDWYLFRGDAREIADGSWEQGDRVSACLSPNRSDRGLLLFHGDRVERLALDAVMPVLHGKNGEDGTVQGLCELAGIPLAGCGTLASALCMDKDRAHTLVSLAGVRVPRSRAFRASERASAPALAAELGYPLFVKPVRGGSSLGISRIFRPEELTEAVEEALRYDDTVVMEEAISGFEVGCAVMGNEELITGVPDEIELGGVFFDYTEKYNLVHARLHCPARISKEQAEAIRETGKRIYRALDCRGFARVDLFLTPEGELVFNEVNTIPGFTVLSRFPNMMKAAGISFEEVVTHILELALEPGQVEI